MLLRELLTKQITPIRTARKSVDDVSDPTDFKWLEGGGYDLPKKWEKLGYGAQTSAFLHTNSGTAVKVLYVEGPQDPAYQFLRLCLQHQNNIHFPKIYTYKQYKTKDPDVSKIIITMERLYKITSSNVNIVSHLLNTAIRTPTSLKLDMKDASFRKQLIENAKTPELKQALRLLEPLFHHYIEDMHMGNVMLRQNGSDYEVVFNDPVS